LRNNLMRLAILLSLTTLAACETIEIVSPLPCPTFPELIAIDPELSEATPKIVRSQVQENYQRYHDYILKLEARAGCE